MEVEEKAAKSKRNSEKRKEKSRYAAKCRRSKESEIFSNLAEALPIRESCNHLDKATVMRLAIAYLRIRNLLSKSSFSNEESDSDTNDKLSLVALGGIIMILTTEGDIVYISNNVNMHLGLTQIDLMGQNVFDVSHPCDHKDIKDVLSGKQENQTRFSLFLRMKSTLTSKGRSVNLKSASYKVLHIIGTMMKSDESKSDCGHHFAAIGSAIPHPSNIQSPLGSYTFLSKHSLDMKFTYADDRMKNFMGYAPENLIGKSLYEFHHVLDNANIQNTFKSLFSKGQSESGEYRFLVKGGGFVWIYTQATVIYTEKTSKPESVVCVNYVVSQRMNENEIFSTYQMEENVKRIEPVSVNKPVASTAKVIVKISAPKTAERPQHSTSKIFARRTPEMNKGFLTFADDDSGCTFLKDEPDDLTHLAPTAGDACISLDTSPFTNTLMDQFTTQLGDPLSPLLHRQDNSHLFLSVIDDASASLSPALTRSPGESSLPPLSCASTNDSNPGEAMSFEDSSVKSFLNFDTGDNNMDDFSFRAPYISMSEGDDLPLLTSADFWPTQFSSGPSSAESSCGGECVIAEDNMDKMMIIDKELDSSEMLHCLNVKEEDSSALSDSLIRPPLSLDQSLVQRCELFTSGEPAESRKRSNLDLYSCNVALLSSKKRRHVAGKNAFSNSVLMNLLVSGQDDNAGYTCINTRKKISPHKLDMNNS